MFSKREVTDKNCTFLLQTLTVHKMSNFINEISTCITPAVSTNLVMSCLVVALRCVSCTLSWPSTSTDTEHKNIIF